MDGVRYLDTYALYEVMDGNPNFLHYLNQNFTISDLTLTEFYALLLRRFNQNTADYWANQFRIYSESTPFSILVKAVIFRKQTGKNISFFDAVGYMHAKENNYLFVTGDKEFETMQNVEFIQK